MKILKQFIFLAVVVIGLSMTAMAQKQGEEKKKPPKDPPQIVVEDKKPKEEKPKNNNPNNDNKGKKPQATFDENGNQIEISFV